MMIYFCTLFLWCDALPCLLAARSESGDENKKRNEKKVKNESKTTKKKSPSDLINLKTKKNNISTHRRLIAWVDR